MQTGTHAEADRWSRPLAILSLLISLGTAIALGTVYYQTSTFQREEALQTTFKTKLAAESQRFAKAAEALEEKYQEALDQQEQRNETWNAELNNVINAFQNDAETLLTKLEQAGNQQITQQRVAFRQALQDLAAFASTNRDVNGSSTQGPGTLRSPQNASAPAANENNSERTGGESTQSGDRRPVADAGETNDPADARPEMPGRRAQELAVSSDGALRVARTALRLGSDAQQSALLALENVIDRPVEISRLRFRPEDHFPAQSAANRLKLPRSIQSIAFQPSDNRASKPGLHGIYDHRLKQPLVIAPGERVTLRLTINDAQHAGWGFVGKLVLDNAGKTRLSVDSVRVLFE